MCIHRNWAAAIFERLYYSLWHKRLWHYLQQLLPVSLREDFLQFGQSLFQILVHFVFLIRCLCHLSYLSLQWFLYRFPEIERTTKLDWHRLHFMEFAIPWRKSRGIYKSRYFSATYVTLCVNLSLLESLAKSSESLMTSSNTTPRPGFPRLDTGVVTRAVCAIDI